MRRACMTKAGGKQSGYYFVLVVVIVLFFAVSMLVLSRSKDNVERLSQQSAGAPGGLGKIEIALRNFVASQKRLPCPADPADASGKEPAGATISCTKPDGVVPWGSIGLSAADALDSWGRKVSYRVYDGATGFTQTKSASSIDGLDASNCNTSTSLTTGVAIDSMGGCATYHESRYADFLTGKGLSVNDRGTVVSGIGYVLISHGASGYGSYGPDSGATRSTLPNASSKEYTNTQALGTYWNQEASASTVQPGDATHFDDVVFYKRASELMDEARLAGRNWGTVSVDKSYSPASVTVGAQSTFTITLTSSVPAAVQLAKNLLQTFPTNVTIGSPLTITNTCGGTAVSATAGATTFTLPAGLQIPAAASCAVSVKVAPGVAATYTDSAFASTALEVTPNLTVTAPVANDAAAVRNMAASSAPVLTATPPPAIVTPSAGAGGSISPSTPQSVNPNNTVTFTVTPNSGYTASVGGTCGGTLSGNSYTTSPIVGDCTVVASFSATTVDSTFTRATFGASTNDTGSASFSFSAYTVSAFADPPNLRDVSAASAGGIGAIVPGSTSGTSLSISNNEGLRFVFNADYRYLGVTLLNFSTGSGSAMEQVMMTFYDASGVQVGSPIIKQSCRSSPTTANFTFDPGANYRRVDIQARTVSNSGTSSVFLLGGITACATGTAAACVVSGSSAANNCP